MNYYYNASHKTTFALMGVIVTYLQRKINYFSRRNCKKLNRLFNNFEEFIEGLKLPDPQA